MKEAYAIIPDNIAQEKKGLILNSIYDCLMLIVDKINNDKKYLDDEQMQFLLQLIGEWTFHKNLDLIYADINKEVSLKILLKVAYENYKLFIALLEKDTNEDDVVIAIEEKVKETFVSSLEKYQNKGLITSDALLNAISQSNVKKMRQAGFREKNKTKTSIIDLFKKLFSIIKL